MNRATRIITAALISMLLCTTVAAYTYEPMPSRSDYDDHWSYQDAYTKRAMDDYQKIANDRQPARAQDTSGGRFAAPNPAPSKHLEDRELERTIQDQIRDHERAPYGIPKQREPISYGRRYAPVNDLPDTYPNDNQIPSLHPVFVLMAIVASIVLFRRRTNDRK